MQKITNATCNEPINACFWLLKKIIDRIHYILYKILAPIFLLKKTKKKLKSSEKIKRPDKKIELEAC